MENIIIDDEIILVPYYPCYEESFAWYQDKDAFRL